MKKGNVEYKDAVPVPIGDLIPYERNAKQHDERQVKNLMKSITDFGFTQPLVIDKDNVIVIGHGRYEAAKRLGLPKVPCIKREDLTDKEVKQLRILDNKLNESPWDSYLYATELESADLSGYELDTEDKEELEPVEAVEDNWAPELDKMTEIQPGEIWQLGEHRLMCGDSTNKADVEKLMGGAAADMLLTDPPYNVDYEGGTGMKIKNDKMSESAFDDFLASAFAAADEAMKPGAAFYIWHADSNGYQFRQACARTGWKLRQCIVWVKNSLVIGRQDYQWKHEPCLYGWKDGAGHYFAPTRKEVTVFENQIDPKKMSKAELIEWASTIINEDETPTTVIHEDKPTRSELHPTMKPVKLMARLIRNSSQEGEAVLDTFGGSGSTLIACEQMNRRCYTMELDPKYAQTIIDRWEAFTGRKAHREAC